jgi:hypothetical protein
MYTHEFDSESCIRFDYTIIDAILHSWSVCTVTYPQGAMSRETNTHSKHTRAAVTGQPFYTSHRVLGYTDYPRRHQWLSKPPMTSGTIKLSTG